MGKRRKKQAHHTEITKHDPASERRRVYRSAIVALLLTIALIWTKILFEHTTSGTFLSYATYDFLQSHLKNHTNLVVVVDTSHLPQTNPTGARPLTDRRALMALVSAIATQRPCAIGIDIDFSPDVAADGTTRFRDSTNDPAFFSLCSRLAKEGVPVFLAVDKTADRPAIDWLGMPEYSSMAVGIRLPRADNRMATAWMQYHSTGERLLSLGYALGSTRLRATPPAREWMSMFATPSDQYEWTNREASAHDFYMDTSSLDAMIAGVISASNALVGAGDFRDRIALLGAADFEVVLDRHFSVAGARHEAVPGVFMHGLAANTVALRPIYHLTHLGRIIIDAMLSLMVVGASVLLNLASIRLGMNWHRSGALSIVCTWLVLGMALYIGVVLVDATGIMWDDYIMVCLALLLHAKVEKWLHPLTDRHERSDPAHT